MVTGIGTEVNCLWHPPRGTALIPPQAVRLRQSHKAAPQGGTLRADAKSRCQRQMPRQAARGGMATFGRYGQSGVDMIP